MNRKRLAELLDVRMNQVYKYERGVNWISAGRLYDIANVLHVPISRFFAEDDEEEELQEQDAPSEMEVVDEKLLQIIRDSNTITDLSFLDALNHLARVLARR